METMAAVLTLLQEILTELRFIRELQYIQELRHIRDDVDDEAIAPTTSTHQ